METTIVMFDLKTLLLIVVILIFAIGYFFSLNVQSNIKDLNIKNSLFHSWIFNSDELNDDGVKYRKLLIICWAINFLLILIYIIL